MGRLWLATHLEENAEREGRGEGERGGGEGDILGQLKELISKGCSRDVQAILSRRSPTITKIFVYSVPDKCRLKINKHVQHGIVIVLELISRQPLRLCYKNE